MDSAKSRVPQYRLTRLADEAEATCTKSCWNTLLLQRHKLEVRSGKFHLYTFWFLVVGTKGGIDSGTYAFYEWSFGLL